MKKSRIYSVLSLALISGMLASCGQNELRYERPFSHIIEASALTAKPGEPEVKREEDGETILINDPTTDPKVVGVQSLEIDVPVFELFYSSSKSTPFAQTRQLNAKYRPYTAKASAFKWSSDHPEIAKVDENTGLVTAVSEGTATITLTSEDGFVATSHCVVNNSNVSITKTGKSAAYILEKQQTLSFSGDIQIREDYTSTRTIDGKVVERTAFAQNIWASREKAYMRITSNDQEVKCEGGSIVIDAVDYIFYTTSDFYTYVFSTGEIAKNYMIVDQSNLVSKGYSRYDAMCLVLQSFFVSGKAIIENQYRDIYGKEDLGSSKYTGAKYVGSLGETSEQFAYNKVSGGKLVVDFDDEEDLGIPAGTVTQLTDDITYLWEKSLMTAKNITETLDYEIEGKPASLAYVVDYFYQSENVEFVYPNLSEYTKVPDIFSL